MPGQIVCARCGKVLNQWDLSQGHQCRRFYYGKWEIREEETLWQPEDEGQEEATEELAGSETAGLRQCPFCHQPSLGFNTILLLWECLNTKCRARVANDDLRRQ